LPSRRRYRAGTRNLGQHLRSDDFKVVWRLSAEANERHLGIDAPYPLAKAIKESARLNGRSMQAELLEVLTYYYLDIRGPE
jgi:hypothetical protein